MQPGIPISYGHSSAVTGSNDFGTTVRLDLSWLGVCMGYDGDNGIAASKQSQVIQFAHAVTEVDEMLRLDNVA